MSPKTRPQSQARWYEEKYEWSSPSKKVLIDRPESLVGRSPSKGNWPPTSFLAYTTTGSPPRTLDDI